MTTYLRPGVNIVENLTALTTLSAPASSAVASFMAVATRGPTVPTLVDSWATFQTLFGDFTNSAYLAYAVYTYFNNGGTPAVITRVAHSDAVAATRSLNDTAGTPLPTLSITAANPGTWGNGITIDITAGYVAGRFNLIVHFGGSVVESYSDLSIVSTDSRYAIAVINAASRYVVAADLHSATSPPANAPAIQSGTALATGVNGGTVVAGDFTTSLALLQNITQPLVLNLPGVSDSAILAVAQTAVAASTSVFLVVDPPSSDSVSSVLAYAATLTATSYAAVYYPWITFADPARPISQNATVALPPGGAVLGQYMATDLLAGPFKTPAGVTNAINAAVGLQANLQPADYDSLNSSFPPVNAIKPIPGYGICVFGGRTLQGGFPSQYIAVRRSLIYLEQSFLNLTQFAIFQSNDAALWESITTKLTQWLTAYWAKGGLNGTNAADSYFVVCDSTNNTPTSIQAGVVNVSVGVALEFPAEFITITIGQYQGGSTVTNSLDVDNG